MKEIIKINKECVSNRILITRIIYLRILSIIYLLSFISLYSQIQGFWGNSGILPANLFLSKIKQNSSNYIISYPSFLWFFNISLNSQQIENSLYIINIFGILVSLLIIFQFSYFFNFVGFSILWYIHYNFYFIGQEFMRFSWDELLLEIGFISIFFSPLNLNGIKAINHITHINNIAFYILKFILFKFMISTGINIITSKCSYWNSFTGLNFFFEEQPLLSPFSFYFHINIGEKIKRVLNAFGYYCLLYMPFGYFLVWRRFSIYAGQITFLFNFFFIIVGNYGYLHLLIIALNTLNFDDYFFRTIFSNKFLNNFKLDYLTTLMTSYQKEKKERKKLLMEKENKVIELKKEYDEEKEKINENNKKKIKDLKLKYNNAKREVVNLIEEDYIDGPKIQSSLKIESNIFNEIFFFVNFFCVNLILIYFLLYPINKLLTGTLFIENISLSKYKTIIFIASILIYIYIIITVIINFSAKIQNSLLLDNNISSAFTNIIKGKDKRNSKINKDNDSELEENSEDENEYDDNNIRKKSSKISYLLNVLLFIFNAIKYFSFIIIFTIYFIGSIKYFLLNVNLEIFEEKVRNSEIANHLERTNYGIFKYLITLSDSIFGKYNIYGIYGNERKEILNALGRSEIEIEYLYNHNNKTWNTINFKYKLNKENTITNFLFFHTPRLDLKMSEVAYNEDINNDPWIVSLIGKIFQKNPIVMDLLNYEGEKTKFLEKYSMFERVKKIYLGKKKSLLLTNDEIEKIRIDIFKYKFKKKYSFIRKRYKEYLSQIEKYAIILINEKLGLPQLNFNEKIEFNKFQFIPIVDIIKIFILINLKI